ncbi:MAG: pyridoxal phosphate-dependent aminotransferase [Acidobacteria bacterium]|nr:pyridoxal phosphate-dependent aminotransferase [Acidobacteriota bacterium]
MVTPRNFAERLQNVQISMIRQVMLRAGGCINLGIGEPDFFAPVPVREEARRILHEEKIGYSPTQGFPELCDHVRSYHGLPDSGICVTNGSQEALFDLYFTLLNPGDEILIPNPGFAAFSTLAILAGAFPVPYLLRRENDFQLDPDSIKKAITPRTRAIVLNSPSNPTGQILTLGQLEDIARISEQNGLTIISDEIYREIYFTREAPASISAVSSSAVILSGVSKMANMTGWRLGWACGPREIIDKMTVMHQYTSSCASTLSQKAALQCFTPQGKAFISDQRATLNEICKWLCTWIEQHLRRPFVRPRGAFYLMLSVEDLKLGSLEVCLELLKDGVAVIPGAAFGSESERFLRISFARERIQVKAGMERLKLGLERLVKGAAI